MKEEKIEHVLAEMSGVLGVNQQLRLREVLHVVFEEVRMVPAESEERQREQANEELLQAFIAAKKIEGCSESTLHYYESTIASLLCSVQNVLLRWIRMIFVLIWLVISVNAGRVG